MKIVVCGGRNVPVTPEAVKATAFKIRNTVAPSKLENQNEYDLRFSGTTILSGCAKGADQVGELAAAFLGLTIERFPADWGKHGKAAGPGRNQKMAEACDLVLALPGGWGTKDMIRRAKELSKPVIQFSLAEAGVTNPYEPYVEGSEDEG